MHLFHGCCAVRAMLWTALLAPCRARRCRWVALRAAALRCETLRCAASCELRRAAATRCSGLVAPSGTRGLGNPAAVKRF